jgi:hypothetical protein
VAGHLLDSNGEDRMAGLDNDYRANLQQNIADAIGQLPKLATGVDVNVRFHDIRGFEFTQDSAIFDLLDVRLLHGWLVDPQAGLRLETKVLCTSSSNNKSRSIVASRCSHSNAKF